MSVYEDRRVREASISGGLGPEEAEELADFNTSMLELGEYRPEDLPALGVFIDGYRGPVNNSDLPADDAETYVQKLMENPEDMVRRWSKTVGPIDEMSSKEKAKRDEYTLRTLIALESSVSQEVIDDTIYGIADQPNYTHHGSFNCDQGNLGLVLGQYLGDIQRMVDDQGTVSEVHNVIAEDSEACACAATNVSIDELDEDITDSLYTGGDELSSELIYLEGDNSSEVFNLNEEDLIPRISTRLRGMVGAGKCSDLEDGHESVLLGEEPTRNNSFVSLRGEVVGSLKYEGDTSMIGLKDIRHGRKQILQKGMVYRVSHRTLDDMSPKRLSQDDEEYSEWNIADTERLELRPLRFAGESTMYSVEDFREDIEKKVQEITEELEEF